MGMIFVPKRHRRLNAHAGREIAQAIREASPPAQTPKIVGNFADQTQEEVNRIVTECGLDFVQLCGEESLEYCGQIDSGVIKVVHVPQSPSPAR